MVQIYIYDEITREYLYDSYADVINNEPLLPDNSTTVKPLAKKEGFAIVFAIKKWKYEEDHRKQFNQETGLYEGGTPYWLPGDTWETEPRFMQTIGSLPKDALLTRPEKPQSVIDEEELERIRDLREVECFSIVDRSQLWYSRLTDDQRKELDEWYEKWLHITDSKPYIIPEKPIWLNPKN